MTLLSLDQFELSLSCSMASCLLLLRNLVHVKVLISKFHFDYLKGPQPKAKEGASTTRTCTPHPSALTHCTWIGQGHRGHF